MEKTNDKKLMITIGMPVYNGEKFLQQKLESFNNQTLKNYQLIISDNASTDKTEEICKKFMQNDKRITYFRQEKNIGSLQNLYFVLNKAKTKYFVWSAVDDFMFPNFLESNIGYLEIDKNVVGSISKIEYFDDDGIRKNIKQYPYKKYPNNSTYQKRASFYLRTISAENIYSIFRTEFLKQSKVQEFFAVDGAIILKVLKFGDIFVSDKTYLSRYMFGISNAGDDLIKRVRKFNKNGLLGFIFPYMPYTIWCTKNLGMKFFLKNIDFFLKINYEMERGLILAAIRRLKKKNTN